MKAKPYLTLCTLFLGLSTLSIAQTSLSLKQALELGIKNYPSLKAKEHYSKASQALVQQSVREQLPNVNLSANQVYGTVNGQLGPAYGFGGLGVSSSGLPAANQSWQAAFGALYLVNVNWEVYSFGKAREKVKLSQNTAQSYGKDFDQEVFKHKVKIAATYLNLLAAQKLTASYRKNLDRAENFRTVVVSRARNGLIAGVDTSLARAECSSAKIMLTKALDFEQEQQNQLCVLLGIPAQEIQLDESFLSQLPQLGRDSSKLKLHPTLLWYESRIKANTSQINYYKTQYYPTMSMVVVYQNRASGFGNTYASNKSDYSTSYWDGINPTRANYLLGVGITWNIAQPFRLSQQVKSQALVGKGLEEEQKLAQQQLQAQIGLSEQKIKNALSNYHEAPIQVKAASDAYMQKSTLYQNGLSNLVDVTQASYTLIRAETDRDIANNNVWQALLLKVAATGDFQDFERQLP